MTGMARCAQVSLCLQRNLLGVCSHLTRANRSGSNFSVRMLEKDNAYYRGHSRIELKRV